MGNPFDPFNLILFLIAVVGFIRLRMILGRRTGNEDPLRQNKYASRVSADIESLTKPKEKKQPKTKEDILLFIGSQLPGFSEKSFLDGASNAYELILKNYADGDLKTIKQRMSTRTHFMPIKLIESQFEALEPPTVEENAIATEIDLPIEALVDKIALELTNRQPLLK